MTKDNIKVGLVNLISTGFYGGFNDFCPSDYILDKIKKDPSNASRYVYGSGYYGGMKNFTEVLNLPKCYNNELNINCIGHFYTTGNILLAAKVLRGNYTIFSYDCFIYNDITKITRELPAYLKIIHKYNPNMKISVIIRVGPSASTDFERMIVLSKVRKNIGSKFNFVLDIESYQYEYGSGYENMINKRDVFIKLIKNFYDSESNGYVDLDSREAAAVRDIFARKFTKNKYLFSKKYINDICIWNGITDPDIFLKKIVNTGYLIDLLPGLYFKVDGTNQSMINILKKTFDCQPVYRHQKNETYSSAHYNIVDGLTYNNIFTDEIRKKYGGLVERLTLKILRKQHLGAPVLGNNKQLYIRKYSTQEIGKLTEEKIKYIYD